MKAAVCLCVFATLTFASGAPHGYVPFIGAIDQTVEEVSKPVAYGYRVKTSTIDGYPTSVTEEHVKTGAYGYKIKAAVPVLLHQNVAPIAAPVVVSQEGASADVSENSGAFSYSVHAAAPIVAHAPVVAAVPITYEQTVVKSAGGTAEDKPSGSFAYSYHAEAPVVAPVPVAHHAVFGSRVAVSPVAVQFKESAEKTEEVSGQSGAFAYSVHAEAPVVAPVPVAAPVPVVYSHAVVKSEEAPAEDKPSGAFSYSYSAEAPVAAPVPVVHHAVVPSAVAVEFKDAAEKTEEVSGQSGAFAYSVHAEAPVVAPAPVFYTQSVVKSEEIPAEDKPSGSFAYSYHAETPVVAPVPVAHHTVFGSRVAVSPVAVQFKESAEKTEEVSGQSGAFAYSIHAEAPVVAPAPVVYSHTVVKSEEAQAEDKPSGAFSYSYSAEAPIAAPVPVVHHAVVPSAVAVEFKDAAEKTEEASGHSGAFAYSVHAEAPVVAPAPVFYTQSVVKSEEIPAEDKPSGSFAYSYHAEAPVVAPVPVAHHAVFGSRVAVSPVAVQFKESAEKTEEVSGQSGAFAYSVHAEAPVVAPVPVAAPVPVVYSHAVVKSEEAPAEDKPSGAFSYSYSAEAPVAAPVPVVHHAVVPSAVAVEFKDAAEKTEDVSGQSGAFAYSVHAEAPVVAPAPVFYTQSVVKSEEIPAEDKPSESFAYSYHAEAPVVAPVPVAHHAVFGSRVAVSPVAVQFKESAEKTEEVSGQSGAFAYSVHAEAPIAAPVSVVAPAPVVYSHTAVKSEEIPAEDKPSGAFSYSYSAEAPIAAPVPVFHHAVVPSAAAVEFKDASEKTEEVSGQSGAFAYSVHAEAPVVAPLPVAHHAVVASPVAVEFKSSAEDIEAASKGSGAFTYNIHEAPVFAHGSYVAAAPVGVAYEHSVVNFGDKIAHEKNAESFGYSYHAEAPVAVSPYVHAVHASAPVAVAPTYVSAPISYNAIPTSGAVSAEVASHDASYGYYVHSGAPLAELETKEPVTTKEVTVKSLGYHGGFGVRTLPLRTVFTGYEHSPVDVESN